MMSPLFGTSMRPDSAQKSGGLPRSLTAGVRWFLPRGPSGGPSRVGSPVGGFATAKLEAANIAMTEIVSAAERRRETPPRYAPRVAYNILTPRSCGGSCDARRIGRVGRHGDIRGRT